MSFIKDFRPTSVQRGVKFATVHEQIGPEPHKQADFRVELFWSSGSWRKNDFSERKSFNFDELGVFERYET